MFTEKTCASFYRYESYRYTALYSLETIDMAPNTNRITLRLPKDTLEALKKEADKKDLPISSIAVRILNKSVSYDMHLKSMPTLIIPQVLFAEIIENMDQITIEKVAKMGPTIVKRLCTLSHWKYDIDSVIDNYFMTVGKYYGWFQFHHKSDHGKYRLVFETRMSKKWTKFLSLNVRSILESLKIHIDEQSIEDDLMIFEFMKR